MLDDDELDILCDKPYKDLTSLERDECLKRVKKHCGLAVYRELRAAVSDKEEASINEMVKAITEESAPWVSSEPVAKPVPKKRGRKPKGTRSVRTLPDAAQDGPVTGDAAQASAAPASMSDAHPGSTPGTGAMNAGPLADGGWREVKPQRTDPNWLTLRANAFCTIEAAVNALNIAEDELRGGHEGTAMSMVAAALTQASVALEVMKR